MSVAAYSWPPIIEPKSRKAGNEYHRYYPIPALGDFVGTTTFLKIVGTGTNALMAWAADIEREATIEACLEVASKHTIVGASTGLEEAIRAKLGHAKKHVLATQKAADIGSEVHARIRWDLCGLTGQKRLLGEPRLSPQSAIAYLAYRHWWDQAGLVPLRAEQTVWHQKLRYAGTVDLFALDPRRGLGILDWKSSKYVYDTHHMQLMAYWRAALEHGLDVKWAGIVQLPKSAEQVKAGILEPVELGHMWDRKIDHERLWTLTQSALILWRYLCEKEN